MAPNEPIALLFDIGGVLLDIDFNRALQAWAPYSSLPIEDLNSKFKFDKEHELHQQGRLSGSEYFAHLGRALKLSASIEEIERGWNSIFVSEIRETRLLVQTCRAVVPCYALTNTNPSHQATLNRLYPKVVRAFEHVFASHMLGLRKPEPEAFMRVCRATGLPPAAFMFFDDLPENVQTAANLGMQGVLVRSSEDVRKAISLITTVDVNFPGCGEGL